MLNYIWFGLMAAALVMAAWNGSADAVTKAAVDSSGAAVQTALGLVGIMALWLGMMRVAEAAGLVALSAARCARCFDGCSRTCRATTRPPVPS